MTTLTEAIAAERSKRQQDAADKATMEQVARTVLEALAERLNAVPLPRLDVSFGRPTNRYRTRQPRFSPASRHVDPEQQYAVGLW